MFGYIPPAKKHWREICRACLQTISSCDCEFKHGAIQFGICEACKKRGVS